LRLTLDFEEDDRLAFSIFVFDQFAMDAASTAQVHD
jgi:hypothetical protein